MKTFVTIVFLAMFILGCKTPPTVNTVANAEEAANVNRIADKRVETDKNLAKGLAVTEVRESVTNDGYMRIQVYFKNLRSKTCKITYRFNWYDDQGAEVVNPDNEQWTRIMILGGDDMALTSVAPKKICRDFKLRLKEIP